MVRRGYSAGTRDRIDRIASEQADRFDAEYVQDSVRDAIRYDPLLWDLAELLQRASRSALQRRHQSARRWIRYKPTEDSETGLEPKPDEIIEACNTAADAAESALDIRAEEAVCEEVQIITDQLTQSSSDENIANPDTVSADVARYMDAHEDWTSFSGPAALDQVPRFVDLIVRGETDVC